MTRIHILFCCCLTMATATANELPQASIAVVDIDYVMQQSGERARTFLLLPDDIRTPVLEIDDHVTTLLRELAAESNPTNAAEIQKEIQMLRSKQMTFLQESRNYGGSSDYRSAMCTYITKRYSKDYSVILKIYSSQRESSILTTKLNVTNISETVVENLRNEK